MQFIYARISTDDKGQTIENQLHSLAKAGYETPVFFADEGISGKTDPLNRPGFSELYAYLQEGDEILLTALDRLSRDTVYALTLIKRLASMGVKVITLRERELSTDTADGLFNVGLAALLAERERGINSERVKQGIATARAAGKRIGRAKASGSEEAIEALREGASIADVMARFGISRATAFRLKKAL
ncbi:recombinase family protein [Salmonella enterica]|nr:recombinase family protein [Salmonella enterica]